MTIGEFAVKYGIESARRQFGCGDHLVFTVVPGKYVVGVCGNWRASEPLGMGQPIPQAKEKIRQALTVSVRLFETEETIEE